RAGRPAERAHARGAVALRCAARVQPDWLGLPGREPGPRRGEPGPPGVALSGGAWLMDVTTMAAPPERSAEARAPQAAPGRAAGGPTTIEMVGVSKWYGDKVAVCDLSCTLGPGVTALLGP